MCSDFKQSLKSVAYYGCAKISIIKSFPVRGFLEFYLEAWDPTLNRKKIMPPDHSKEWEHLDKIKVLWFQT